jgi:acyl-CoA thioester hydrolase
MPLTHTRLFRVRYYECDLFGYMHHANYLRYMQEAAFDASSAAGYAHEDYDAMGRIWLARQTEIEHFRPLHYDDSVQITTWVADWRRVRSRRAYEFRLDGSNEPVARAYTDWVFLESASSRPTSIPPEMMAAFVPEGQLTPARPRARLPAAPPPPSGTFHMRRQVAWPDIDQAQHVNNAVHLEYLEDCEIHAFAAFGWPPSRMAQAGFAFRAEHRLIDYLQPALLHEELELSTWISDLDLSGALWHHTVTRPGDSALLVRARSHIRPYQLGSDEPIPIPDEFLGNLSRNIASRSASKVKTAGAKRRG